jgi:hypothetical protein
VRSGNGAFADVSTWGENEGVMNSRAQLALDWDFGSEEGSAIDGERGLVQVSTGG